MIYEIDSEGEQIQENRPTLDNRNKDQQLSPLPKETQLTQIQQQSSNQKLVGEKDFQLLSTKNILGKVTFMRFFKQKVFYFGLDLKKGRILCYKSGESKKFSLFYTIIKGQILDEQAGDHPQTLRVKSKKGKKFQLDLFQEKDKQIVKNYLQSCINQNYNQEEDEDTQYKGFFAFLGRGTVSIFKAPYRVCLGVLVSDQLPEKNKMPLTPNDIFNQAQSKKQEKHIPMSGMFFGTSPIVKEILGSIAVLHGQYQEAQSCFSLSQDISTGESQCAVALIFKPILGTIDMVIMKMRDRDLLYERNLYQDIFKVKKIKKKAKKNQKKYLQREQEKNKIECMFGIDDTQMEQVQSNQDEILYLKKNNGILKRDDIEKMHKWGQIIHLGDVDGAKKKEEEDNMDQELINEMLDFYKKEKLCAKGYINAYEEEICEFMVVYPTPQLKIEDSYMELEQENMDMEEVFGEEIMINDERYVERYEDKWLPRVQMVSGTENHDHQVKNIKGGLMPAFQISKSPFSKQKEEEEVEDGFLQEDILSQHETKQFDIKVQEDQQYNGYTQNDKLQQQNIVNQTENTLQDLKIESNLDQGNQDQFKQPIIINVGSDDYNNEQVIENNTNLLAQDTVQLKPVQTQKTEILKQTSSTKTVLLTNNQSSQQNSNNNQNNNNIINNNENNQIDEESSSDSEEEDQTGIINAKCDYQHVNMSVQEIQEWVKNFKGFDLKDQIRISEAHKNGGKICTDKAVVQTTRGVGKYILGQIGRKILSGDFNLTTVSFPIKAMIPRSALQTSLYGTILFPYYMNLASSTNDPVERFKYVIVATFANFPIANGFLKPLNPILGETFEAGYSDGTKIYAEQTSHHPPVSTFLTIGPNKSYTYSGYYLFDAKAGFNSLKLQNKGKRKIIFHSDGQVIDYDFGYELYSGSFMGTMKHESLGSVEFVDSKNNIRAVITTGKVKKKPSDYISGDIIQNGEVKSKCFGSYNGFIEFDGKRFWDFREVVPFGMIVEDNGLPSDHVRRTDRQFLAKGQLNKAQKEKERLELIQRTDRKLREKFQAEKAKMEKKALKNQKKLEKQQKNK